MQIRLFQTESIRLAAIYAALFVGSMALLIALIYFIVSDAFEANLLRNSDDDLSAIRRAYVAEVLKKTNRGTHEAKEMIDDRLLATDRADVFLLQKGLHTRIAGNLPVMTPKAGALRFPDPLPTDGGNPEDHIILGRGEFLDRDLYAFVGRDLYAAKRAEEDVLRTFGWVLLASLLVASAGGLLLSRSFLRRVDAITDTCRSIMAGKLGDRIPMRGTRNELDQLAATINDMLDRIGVLMESLRQVSNDIAHDLRTPLAHLRYRLERTRLAAKNTGDYATAVDAAIADADQLLAMFAALLRIAQLEAGARQAGFEEVDLEPLLGRVSDLYKPAMDDAGRPFYVDLSPCSHVRGDPQLLLQLFANLLDNAVHHTPDSARVSLTMGMDGARPTVVVADEGLGIPPEDREKVFRRFFRREQSRTTPGSGLGLALVSAIADLHGAEISLLDNAPGLRVVVKFPATP
ncbi:MAG: HAMP domain-containing histidine kinase [Alphaproteobacteria bacterium]|nr:HAMP domain-containing histidine kinase [Alphaproteobacteria bacterium]